MKKLIIIPAYNEEKNIKNTIESIRKVKDGNLDILVINDYSKDKTKAEAQKAGVKVINLPINLGIGGAVQTGFKYAFINNYDIAIQIDGDGQHDPKYINKLIVPILDNQADVVIGSRFIKNNKGFRSTFLRRIGIKTFEIIYKLLTNHKISDSTSGFRAYNRKAIEFLKDDYPLDYPEPEVIISLFKRKFKIIEIPVIMNYRIEGESSISRLKSIYYMVKVILSIFVEFIRR